MDGHVSDSEMVARFIFSSSDYRVSDLTVKYSAFMPARDLAASVYRIDGCDEAGIAQIDQDHISGKRKDGKISKGRADIRVEHVRKSKLDVVSEPSPHPRHANIEGYLSNESENRMKAIELAQQSKLVLKK